MVFINNCVIFRSSIYKLKFLNKFYKRTIGCTSARPLVANFNYAEDEGIWPTYKCNILSNYGPCTSKFLAVNSKCINSCDVRSIRPYTVCHYAPRPKSLLISSLSPLILATDNKFSYSTGSGGAQGNRPDDCKDKLGSCNIDTKTSNSPFSEKIKSCDSVPPDDRDVVEKKLSLFQKFKEMYRDYWYVLLPVHCVTSGFWFAGFYFVADSGVDIVSILEYIGINETLIQPFRNGNGHIKAGIIAVAFALYKIATPIRYAVTLGGTTVAINYLKKSGYIKPIPKKERLKEMYLEQKDILLEKKHQLKSNMFQHLKEIDSSSPTKRK